MLALYDPTLFSLPHRENFSGPAWLEIQPPPFEPYRSTEATKPLTNVLEHLGAAFASFMDTNPPPRFESTMGAGSLDVDPMVVEQISEPSTLRIEGGLARRALLTPVHLPPQTNSDILPNTEVQLFVNGQGNTLSAVVLSGSGSQLADATALNFARNARFEPIKAAALGTTPPDKTTFGKLIFEWQDRVFRCTKCGSVYTDDPDVDRSRCVQCGQLNEAIEF
jgi:TonB family protein